jgi:hypothetical protein
VNRYGAPPDRGLLPALVGDGRPLLSLTGVALFVSGLFAIFLATRREFLPHDIAFLGISADELCQRANCRIVAFMFHDRVAFGGTLISVAILYLWLAAFPLRDGERWAWRAFAVSGAAGFVSFLAYLGYGYLDTWHGAATLALLPTFLVGLVSSSRLAVRPPASWLKRAPGAPMTLRAARWMLLGTAGGLVAAGLTILVVGMTQVFVPQDLQFMGLDRSALDRISPRLIPLIAHDRAGFGGGLMSTGLLIAFCGWYAPPSRSFLEAIVAAGAAGFGCAIGVHFAEGYTDFVHLAPALVGALLFVTAVVLEIAGLRQVDRKAGGQEARSAKDEARTTTRAV